MSHGRTLLTVALVCAFVAVVIPLWLTREVAAPTGKGFNVILISLDTVRADHLGCYGHPTVATPNIDRLANEGVIFTQCTASVPITLPSHASILTGTYPFVHGVRDNGSFHLHDDAETIAETLSEAAYTTGGIVGSLILNREYGTHQGFDLYSDMHNARQPINPVTGKAAAERRADEVVDVAVDWLRAHGSGKFFLFVHFFDPHYPYEPPEPYATRYEDRYAGEIAFVDEQIGRLLGVVRGLGVDSRTLVVLTADHGESLGQHEEDTHGCFVYDTTLSVPLILRCPSRIPARRRVPSQARTVDIAPTILSFVGAPSPPAVQGVNLLPFLREDSEDPGLAAYGESMYPLYNYGYSHLLALRAGGWKYIHAPRPELYKVDEDPGELQNLAALEPHRLASMRERLRAVLDESPVLVGTGEAQLQMTQRAIEALQSLGYVGNTSTDAVLTNGDQMALMELTNPDPKDHTEVIRLSARSLHLMEARDLPEAEKVLRELLERFPESQVGFSWAYKNLGLTLAAQGKDYEEAIALYHKALEINPNDGQTLTNLGFALGATGRVEEAITAYRAALRLKPVMRETHINLAATLRYVGRIEEAKEHERIAAEMAGSSAPAGPHPP